MAGRDNGRYSRKMFQENKRYAYAMVQEGIPWVDADSNDNSVMLETSTRRVAQILGDGSPNDGFKIAPSGVADDFIVRGGGGSGDNAGRFFLKGISAQLFSDIRYVSLGSTWDERSIHPVITEAVYDSVVARTTIRDSSANYPPGFLVGRTITPGLTGLSYAILSNTATEIVVAGNVTPGGGGLATAGAHYRLETPKPGSGTRLDGIYLNVWLTEITETEDPDLIHLLSAGVVAQLRYQVQQVIYVQQGIDAPSPPPVFADYIDSDGRLHYVIKIAEITRRAAETYPGSVNPTDIVDLRPLFGDGTTYGLVGLWDEIVQARGNLGSLDERLDVSTDDDGKIRIGTVDRLQINMLRPHPASTPNNTLVVEPGVWTTSNGTGLAHIDVATAITIPPLADPNKEVRFDLITVTDAGVLNRIAGIEYDEPPTRDPLDPAMHPPVPTSEVALAIVRVTEHAGVVVDGMATLTNHVAGDVMDVREFLNKGGGTGGGGTGPGAGATIYKYFSAADGNLIEGQTAFYLLHSPPNPTEEGYFTMDNKHLRVFRNGDLQRPGVDYNEVSSVGGPGDGVVFLYPIHDDEEIFFLVMEASAETVVTSRYETVVTDTLPPDRRTFTPGFAPLTPVGTLVFSGGVLMQSGSTSDYTISVDGTQIVFNVDRTPGERIVIIQIGKGDAFVSSRPDTWDVLDVTADLLANVFPSRMSVDLVAGTTRIGLFGTYMMGVGGLDVYRNGKHLTPGVSGDPAYARDYVETGTNSIVLNFIPVVGDVLEFKVPNGAALSGATTLSRLTDVSQALTDAFHQMGGSWGGPPSVANYCLLLNNFLVFPPGNEDENIGIRWFDAWFGPGGGSGVRDALANAGGGISTPSTTNYVVLADQFDQANPANLFKAWFIAEFTQPLYDAFYSAKNASPTTANRVALVQDAPVQVNETIIMNTAGAFSASLITDKVTLKSGSNFLSYNVVTGAAREELFTADKTSGSIRFNETDADETTNGLWRSDTLVADTWYGVWYLRYRFGGADKTKLVFSQTLPPSQVFGGVGDEPNHVYVRFLGVVHHVSAGACDAFRQYNEDVEYQGEPFAEYVAVSSDFTLNAASCPTWRVPTLACGVQLEIFAGLSVAEDVGFVGVSGTLNIYQSLTTDYVGLRRIFYQSLSASASSGGPVGQITKQSVLEVLPVTTPWAVLIRWAAVRVSANGTVVGDARFRLRGFRLKMPARGW